MSHAAGGVSTNSDVAPVLKPLTSEHSPQETDTNAVQGVYHFSRFGNLSGGPVPEHQFDDAMRLYSRNY